MPCQRRRAKVQAESAGRIPYPKRVVLYPTGGPDLPERPESRSVVRQLRSDVAESVDGVLSRALARRNARNPFFDMFNAISGYVPRDEVRGRRLAVQRSILFYSEILYSGCQFPSVSSVFDPLWCKRSASLTSTGCAAIG